MNKIKKILPIILAFVLVFGSCLTVSAEELPFELPITDYTYDNNLVFHDGSQYILITSEFQYYYDGVESMFPLNSGKQSCYITNDLGKTWTYTYEANDWSMGAGMRVVQDEIIYSSYDIKDQNGNIFFRGPVTPVELALEELPETINSQVAVILTIAVVCLALLVTLSVLRKKLPSFL